MGMLLLLSYLHIWSYTTPLTSFVSDISAVWQHQARFTWVGWTVLRSSAGAQGWVYPQRQTPSVPSTGAARGCPGWEETLQSAQTRASGASVPFPAVPPQLHSPPELSLAGLACPTAEGFCSFLVRDKAPNASCPSASMQGCCSLLRGRAAQGSPGEQTPLARWCSLAVLPLRSLPHSPPQQSHLQLLTRAGCSRSLKESPAKVSTKAGLV